MSSLHRDDLASPNQPPDDELPRDQLPRHIAFIMDGNGRWAKKRGRLRVFGHEHGAESIRRISRRCRSLGIQEITFYALSTENFLRRPAREVNVLMRLLERFVVDERPELLDNDIRFEVIGDYRAFPARVVEEIDRTIALTANRREMVLRLALNYGSRQEIWGAVLDIARSLVAGDLSIEELEAGSADDLRRHLADPGMRDPDLVVRTAGEYRLSNFLLWQASYAEWWVAPELWPDFGVPELDRALRAFVARERRYGGIGSTGPDGQISERPVTGGRLDGQ